MKKEKFKETGQWIVSLAPREGAGVCGLWPPEATSFYDDGRPAPVVVGDFHFLFWHALMLNGELKP